MSEAVTMGVGGGKAQPPQTEIFPVANNKGMDLVVNDVLIKAGATEKVAVYRYISFSDGSTYCQYALSIRLLQQYPSSENPVTSNTDVVFQPENLLYGYMSRRFACLTNTSSTSYYIGFWETNLQTYYENEYTGIVIKNV